MKWLFKEVPQQEELRIILEKQVFDQEVKDFLTYLEGYDKAPLDRLIVKVDGEIVIIPFADLLALDLDGDYINIITITQTWSVRGRLYQMKEKLADREFVQISRQSLININHLKRMEASFSGNMLAILSSGLTLSVSRRYVKNLEKKLGL